MEDKTLRKISEMLVEAMANEGIVKNEAEMNFKFSDGTFGRVKFDLILNVKEIQHQDEVANF